MSKDKICIIQDCDVDGITSCSLITMYLLHLGVSYNDIKILYHIGKQHGLSSDIMPQIKKDCRLLIIPDAGSNDVEQCKELQQRGIKTLILDHHQSIQNSYATVINNQLSLNVNNKNLAGVGVTFKFISYCCQQQNDNWYKSLLDIVMLGNLADVMDMRQLENRAFNYWGLRNIHNPFFKALCDNLIRDDINPKSIIWSVVPKLNAVCRFDNQKLKQAIMECFIGIRQDYTTVIDQCVEQHKIQSDTVSKMYEELINANIPNNNKVMIIECEKSGYTGLVANKLMEHYNKPILLVHLDNDEYIGSCRSQVPLLQNLKDSGLMTISEGHNNIFGVGWLKDNTIALQEYCNKLNFEEQSEAINVALSLNANNKIPDYLFSAFENSNDIWCNQIPKPQFHIHNIKIKGSDIILAKNDKTIMFNYNGVKYIKFSTNQSLRDKLHIGGNQWIMLEIICEFGLNYYRGKVIPNIYISDLEVAEMQNNIIGIDDIF